MDPRMIDYEPYPDASFSEREVRRSWFMILAGLAAFWTAAVWLMV